jgi:FkbM family methyltransferase
MAELVDSAVKAANGGIDGPSEDALAQENPEALAALAAKWRWLFEMKPRRLGAFLLQAFGPWERRRIANTKVGVRLYVDPFTHLGQQILLEGCYEAETVEILRRQLGPGKVFLDVGANEGFYSAVVGCFVGPSGMVIAVEPQRACRDLIEINLRINKVSWARIYSNAMGGADGQAGTLLSYAPVNTGLSSIVSPYHSTTGTEEFRFVSLERILQETKVARVDLAKIDVEGFEYEVVQSLLPHIREGRVRALLVEYHHAILLRRKLSPMDIHNALLAGGMRAKVGDPQSRNGIGLTHVVYELQ